MPLKDREEYNDYMNRYMKDRYDRCRSLWIAKLGGRCVDCGSTEDLQFDHEDSTTKSFDVAKHLTSASEAKLVEEMEKCVLRCQPCHHQKSLDSKDYRGMRK